MLRLRPKKIYRSKRRSRKEINKGSSFGRKRGLEITIEPDEQDSNSATENSFRVHKLWSRLGQKGRFLITALLIAMCITALTIHHERNQMEIFITADKYNVSQTSLGKNLYQANCAFCHGDDLEGKPGWNEKYAIGKRPAPPLKGAGNINKISDRDLFDITKFGGQPFSPRGYVNEMPGFEMLLSDSEIWAILAYIRFRG
ncbi:MAG: hypothetical protein CMM58_00240 [Rhodospirillaceae bacterium]|nr:hypothetical protein [Rhodospirillaceae bacterium]|tara:strand:- start:1094 stop:1693 length:600 start_codon:yes stop_codon:yes gene_type:complete